MSNTKILPLALFCLLSACDARDPVADEANGRDLPAAVSAAADEPPSPPDGSRPMNRVAEASVGQDRPVPIVRIPAFLHGRWGMTPEDCTSARGDSKGLLTITANELRFYESRAVPVGNLGGTEDSFTADFAFTGEGQNWTGFETLQIQDRRLVRTTSSPMASYTYAKCS